MTRTKKTLMAIILVIMLGVTLLFGFNTTTVKADTVKEGDFAATSETGDVAEPMGIFTNIAIEIHGGNGEIWAKAINTFTLFPATVQVYVELYSSETYQDSYTNMQLVCRSYTEDLDMNNSIEARVSTHGVQKYWKARAYYKVDSNAWTEKVTKTYLYDGDGKVLEEL